MSRVEDVVIKTVISGELPIAGACKAFMNQKTNCFGKFTTPVLMIRVGNCPDVCFPIVNSLTYPLIMYSKFVWSNLGQIG